MRRNIVFLLAGVAVAAVPLLHGAASAAAMSSALKVQSVDIWQMQCTSSLTACMRVQVCDAAAGTDDDWEVTIGVYAPAALLGKGGTAAVITGHCSPEVSVCRVPHSLGVMKALVNINHPGGDGDDTYTLVARCIDQQGQPLPDNHTILNLKTNNP